MKTLLPQATFLQPAASLNFTPLWDWQNEKMGELH
jgi:hypothetical protein